MSDDNNDNNPMYGSYSSLPSDFLDATRPASQAATPTTPWDKKQSDMWSGQKGDTSHLLQARVEQSDDPDAVRNLEAAFAGPGGSAPAPVDQGGINLSTMRTLTGMRIADTASLTAQDVVQLISGEEMTVEVAVTCGFMRKDANGRYVPTGAAAEGQQQEEPSDEAKWEAEQAEQNAENPQLEPATQAMLTQAIEAAPGATLGAATSLIESNGDMKHAVEQVVSGLGLEPGVAHARIAAVTQGYATEAYQVTAQQAATSPDRAELAIAAMRAENPAAFKEAAHRHFETGKPNYAAAMESYLVNLEKSEPHTILNATPVPGRSVRWDAGSGRILVKNHTEGFETTWDSAVRMKWVSLKTG